MFQRVNTLNSRISITEAASDAKLSAMDRSQAELQSDINNAKIIFCTKCPLLSNPVTYYALPLQFARTPVIFPVWCPSKRKGTETATFMTHTVHHTILKLDSVDIYIYIYGRDLV